jgi:hypothetical protein
MRSPLTFVLENIGGAIDIKLLGTPMPDENLAFAGKTR